MKSVLRKIVLNFYMGSAYLLSITPLVKKVGRPIYAAGLFGSAMGFYLDKNYKSSLKAFDKAINYSKGMEDTPPVNFCLEEGYKMLGVMHEKGLGVEIDELKAEEYYLKAGSRGDSEYEHYVATKSYDEKYK